MCYCNEAFTLKNKNYIVEISFTSLSRLRGEDSSLYDEVLDPHNLEAHIPPSVCDVLSIAISARERKRRIALIAGVYKIFGHIAILEEDLLIILSVNTPMQINLQEGKLLKVGHRGLGYLRRDCIPLLVLVICERRPVIEKGLLKVIHVICKIVFENNSGVVLARLHTLYGLISGFRELPADLVAGFQILRYFFSHIDVCPIFKVETRVKRSDGDLYFTGVCIRIRIGKYVHPRVKSRKHRNRHYNSQRKKAPA